MVRNMEKRCKNYVVKTVFVKKMENLRNRINVRLVSNKKGCSKWTSKPKHLSQKLLDDDLVAIRKSRVTLKPNIC